jgi:hypothetical protein
MPAPHGRRDPHDGPLDAGLQLAALAVVGEEGVQVGQAGSSARLPQGADLRESATMVVPASASPNTWATLVLWMVHRSDD